MDSAMNHANSDSALNTSTSTAAQHSVNISKRHKRTFCDYSVQSESDDLEIKTMVADIKTQQDQKFEAITNAMNLIISQNQGIQKTVEVMSSQYEELLVKSNFLEKENTDLKQRVLFLENQLEQSDKNSRSATIEIRNIPKQNNESKKVLTDIVKVIGSALALKDPIETSEIRNIFRSKSEAIVVDFTCTTRKESIVSEYKKVNKTRRASKKPQLNTTDVNISGPLQTLFISESLTSKTRRIFYLAREHVKNNKLASAWTSYGKIYVRKDEGTASVRIDEEVDLQKMFI